MRTALLLLVVLAFSLCSSGCESGSDVNYEWKSYRDTLSISPKSDSIKFQFDYSIGRLDVLTIPSVSNDLALSDTARLELEIEKEVAEGKNIIDGSVVLDWISDTLTINLTYNSNIIVAADSPASSNAIENKAPSQLPQRTPKQPVLRITSAKLFLPPGVSATYIGE